MIPPEMYEGSIYILQFWYLILAIIPDYFHVSSVSYIIMFSPKSFLLFV